MSSEPSFIEKIQNMVASVNNVMDVIDGKIRSMAQLTDVYTRAYLDDATKTLGANAASASKLKIVRSITLDGDALGSKGFDGSKDITLNVTIPKLAEKADKTSVYTKAEMEARLESIIGAAPDLLDTFAEIAVALGDDPNFAATMTAELAKKANQTGVYTKAEADSAFLSADATANNALKFGNNLPSHYATASSVESLEQTIGDAFTQLAQAFDDGATSINNIGA
ncbi:hypothetical protein HW45_07065 [Vibrio sp. ER1A]|nr:hypothetical protein HW45_07065 [Vibrio sp. ER1A]